MKKKTFLLIALALACALTACTKIGSISLPTIPRATEPVQQVTTEATVPTAPRDTEPVPQATTEATVPTASTPSVKVMTYAQYAAAGDYSDVIVETYVQAARRWQENKITVYCQSPDGAYFSYEMQCSEEDSKKLLPGTKIRISGVKSDWHGEIEIMEGTFDFVDGDPFIAEPLDITSLLGTNDLIQHQNKKITAKGLTVEAISYQNGAPGKDIYLILSLGGKLFEFCVESDLIGPETVLYNKAGKLSPGDVIDAEGFLYWYEGPNPHITDITIAASAPEGKVYELTALNAEITVPEEYSVYALNSGFTEQMCQKQGIVSVENMTLYLQVCGDEMYILPEEDSFSDPSFIISIRVKEKDYGVENLKDLNSVDFKLMADSLVAGFSGADGYAIYENDTAKYIVFDCTILEEQCRYATIIDGKMVYFIIKTDGKTAPADHHTRVRTILDTLKMQ